MTELLDLKEVCKLTRLSPSTILRLEKNKKFPSSRKLGDRRVFWSKSEITEWIDVQMSMSEGYVYGEE